MTSRVAASLTGRLPGAIAQMGEARLQVQGERIVDRVTDAARLEVRLQIVAPRHANRVLVEDRLVGRIDSRRTDRRIPLEGLVVVRRVAGARGAPLGEVRKLGQQHRRLQGVEPAVESDFVMEVVLATRRAAAAARSRAAMASSCVTIMPPSP